MSVLFQKKSTDDVHNVEIHSPAGRNPKTTEGQFSVISGGQQVVRRRRRLKSASGGLKRRYDYDDLPRSGCLPFSPTRSASRVCLL